VGKSFLESRNLKVFTTSSAAEVLKLAEAVRPDLVVLDYEMPEMNGDEVCRRLRQSAATKQIPVLILSAHVNEAIQARCEAAGAAGFVRKSEGRDALLDSVAAVLGLPQRRHLRVPCSISVGILSEDRKLEGMVHNISQSGLYLTVDAALKERSLLRMALTLPGASAPIRFLGEVVRAETLSGDLRGYGIQMIEADETSQAALMEFVKATI
jgi:CheY-like chemotaxis protein